MSYRIHQATVTAIVRYCAEEIERQKDKPSTVADLFDAWMDALRDEQRWEPKSVTIGHVATWARIAKPRTQGLFRKINLQHADTYQVIGIDWSLISASMTRLFEAIRDGLGPNEAYYEYEKIHPWIDGNGRTGKILFNWINCTLEDPVLPPKFFDVV